MPLYRKILFLAVCFIYFHLPAQSQDVADTAFEKTMLWRITGNGLKDTSFLFGTAHPIFREDIRVPTILLASLRHANAVYFEYIPDSNEDSVYRQQNLMNKPKLEKVLGNICYARLIDILEKYNDPVLKDPQFDQLAPQYFGGQLLKSAFGKSLTSVDALLMAIAVGNDQKIFALDRPELRNEIMENTSLDQQATTLFMFLDEFEKRIGDYAGFIKAMTEKYNDGDLAFLYTRVNYIRINDQMFGSRTIRKPILDQLLDKRNKEWIPIIMEACKTNPSFFAFGAAHLGGRKGIITLLRNRGYSVEPVFMIFD